MSEAEMESTALAAVKELKVHPERAALAGLYRALTAVCVAVAVLAWLSIVPVLMLIYRNLS